MKKVKFLSLAAGLTSALVLGTMSNAAMAEWKPSGPIKMMIGFKAGGGVDTQARLIAEGLTERYGWKVIPEQVTGKGGLNLLSKLKKAPADGTTIGIVVSESLSYNMISAKRSGMKPSEFTPLASTASFQMGIVAKSGRGWKTMHDVFKDAKAGKNIKFGAASAKLADLTYVLGKRNGVEFSIINTKGGKGVVNGINADDIDMGFAAGIQNKAVLAGDLVHLASGIPEPLKITPESPLLSEFNLPDLDASGFFLFAASSKISDEAREALGNAIAEIVNDPSSKANQFINKAFGGPTVLTGGELDKKVAAQLDASERLLKAASE